MSKIIRKVTKIPRGVLGVQSGTISNINTTIKGVIRIARETNKK